jgi:protein-S-isoprenylcysteine O-methyltransferase Ste14
MIWGLAYAALVVALFVRVRARGDVVPAPPAPAADEPVRLVTVHHLLFYVLLLVACPLEALLAGGAQAGRLLGLVAFAVGVALYRAGVAALGDALSPLVTPHPGGRLVTTGAYRVVRHPMYLGQLLIAFGAPATLGCRWAFALSFAAAIVLFVRIALEENALATAYGEYREYRARSKRLVPFVF